MAFLLVLGRRPNFTNGGRKAGANVVDLARADPRIQKMENLNDVIAPAIFIRIPHLDADVVVKVPNKAFFDRGMFWHPFLKHHTTDKQRQLRRKLCKLVNQQMIPHMVQYDPEETQRASFGRPV